MSSQPQGNNFYDRTTVTEVPAFRIASSGDHVNSTFELFGGGELFQDDFVFPAGMDFSSDLFGMDDPEMDSLLDNYSGMDYEETGATEGGNETATNLTTIPQSSVRSASSSNRTAKAEPVRRKVIIKAVPRQAQRAKKAQGGAMNVDDMEERDLSEEQLMERRFRNRFHAKSSRERKVTAQGTLEASLVNLRKQNSLLRRVIAERLPAELAAKVLLDCTAEESTLLADGNPMSGPGSSDEEGALKPSALTVNIASNVVQSKAAQQRGGGGGITPSHHHNNGSSSSSGVNGKRILMEPDYRLIASLITSQQNFVLSDPSLPDNPIVYASDGFCRLSGYRRQDILGRNCRFLQGPGTDQAAVNVIRKGLAEGKDISVCLLNYRADGSPFWNQFFLGALKDAQGNIVNYVGVQCEVNVIPVSEMKDRVKKLHQLES